MCASGRLIGDPRLSADGGTVAFATVAGDRAVLATVAVDGGPEVVITTEPVPSCSDPGGRGVFDWTPDGSALVYVTAAGGLRYQPITGGPARTVSHVAEDGAAAPAVSPDGSRVAYTLDQRHVVVAWIHADDPWPVLLSTTADFCADPTWSPAGDVVAWHEWDVPAMAWDASHIALARARTPTSATDVDDNGAADEPRRVAAGPQAPGAVSVGQPRYSPDGSFLGYLCDAGGWLNLWVADADGSNPRPVLVDDHEHGGPTWGSGQRSWAWSPDGTRVAVARNEQGFGRLILLELASGEVTTIGRGIYGGLSWRGDRLVAVRSGAVTPDQLVAYDLSGLPAPLDHESPDRPPRLAVPRRILARGPVAGFEAAGLVEPQSVQWDAEAVAGVGTVVHGRLTVAPQPPAGSPGAANPLIVWVHGGPTGQHRVAFNARAAYFTARGFNLLQVDPRGSTGWGRAYTQALRDQWARLDVDDVAAGIRVAFAAGWGDPKRTAIMGASSGGLVALGVLARHPALCTAGVDLYGVTDLIDLDDTARRFEAHYSESLIGPRPDADALYRKRSPRHLAGGIVAPLLVLHGTADDNVVQGQSDTLVESLRLRDATVEYHLYEGEGHGWSRSDTVRDELDRIDAFLTHHVLRLPRRPIP